MVSEAISNCSSHLTVKEEDAFLLAKVGHAAEERSDGQEGDGKRGTDSLSSGTKPSLLARCLSKIKKLLFLR